MAGDVSVLPGPSVGFVRGENIEEKGVMSGRKKGTVHKIMENPTRQGT